MSLPDITQVCRGIRHLQSPHLTSAMLSSHPYIFYHSWSRCYISIHVAYLCLTDMQCRRPVA